MGLIADSFTVIWVRRSRDVMTVGLTMGGATVYAAIGNGSPDQSY